MKAEEMLPYEPRPDLFKPNPTSWKFEGNKVYTNYVKDLFNNPSSDGGPSSYYDFPQGALTLNDLLEYKGDKQWKGDSFHLSNIVKATWRWGQKSGIDEAYDSRKIIYSGCRLLMKYAGVAKLRETLQALLDDPQFQERDTK